MTVGAYLEKADRYLQSARLLLADGDTASCVSRAYYAMFYTAEAALLTRDMEFKSHAGVINRFGEEFVRDGTFPREMKRDLSRAFKERQHSEYDGGHTTHVRG